jgi:ABC-type lipoprotein export system ATPase subunit
MGSEPQISPEPQLRLERTTAEEPAITARGLVRIYPVETVNVPALRGLDLTVLAGEVVGVVGPSGSGKSTLLGILAGLDRPSAGSLTVFGTRLERAGEEELGRYRTETVGVVEQHYWRAISPYLTARRMIELPLALRGWPAVARGRRSEELLGRIGLADRGDAHPAELSGGEQQRVAFAAALACRPRIILADEPTGELDERTASELLTLLRELVRAEGATAIVVTHDAMVESSADRIVYLHDGRNIGMRVGRDGPVSTTIDASGWTAPAVPEPPPPVGRMTAPASRAVAVELEGISRRYGHGPHAVLAIDGLSVRFASGGLHVVTGPSGSGKSTLLRLVTGLDRPTAGVVRTLGADLATLDRTALAELRAGRIATMSQAPRLVPFLSVVENVELGLAVRRRGSGAERRARALAALGQVGLTELAEILPDVLSGGERARVALARSLAADPELLVLDEPTSALHRASAAAVIELLTHHDPAMTVVVATHDRDLNAAASDRLDLRDVRRARATAAVG